jgi:hypothetical protein
LQFEHNHKRALEVARQFVPLALFKRLLRDGQLDMDDLSPVISKDIVDDADVSLFNGASINRQSLHAMPTHAMTLKQQLPGLARSNSLDSRCQKSIISC